MTTGNTPCGICGKRGWAHTDVAPTRSQGCGCYDDWRKTTTASGPQQPGSTIFRSIRRSSTSPSTLPSLSRKARKWLGYLVCKRWDTLEKNGRQVLRSDEYTKMLSLAGANPRDYAIIQVFLQTGIRVSELANLTRDDIDFVNPSITVWGKGSIQREIFLEKKGVHALKSYLAVRGESFSPRVFLNYQGEPISERGIRKLVVKYRKEAGITKKASCHTLRHTFATCKAEKGVPAYQLQQWLGHANLNTTQIYIHLGKQNARKIMQDTSI